MDSYFNVKVENSEIKDPLSTVAKYAGRPLGTLLSQIDSFLWLLKTLEIIFPFVYTVPSKKH